ncbi:MAG: DUF6600 domain-containing protein [Chitinophagales bacterium]
MRRILSTIIVLVFSLGFILGADKSYAQGAAVSFQIFYDQLSPYGSWVNYNQYGYVWIPTRVSQGFRPYGSSGQWVYTPDGWTWVSDYSWGWAPFHYGNWFYDDAYGWMWAPGYEWAPAWVTWGEYGDNYGWAPIAPRIQIGVAWNTYRPPVYCWTFVPRNYMGRPNMNTRYVHYNTRTTIVNNITVINNINSGGGRPQYMRGPQASSVERYTHSTVRPVNIRESARPGRAQVQNGQVTIYRPAVNRAASPKPPAPSRVQSLQKVKPATLPGYNRNVRRPAQPASANRTSAPANQPVRPAPNNGTVQPRTARAATTNPQPARPSGRERIPKPAPNQRSETPAPQPQNTRPVAPRRNTNPVPHQQQQTPRTAPQEPRPAPQHQTPRPAPQHQTPRPAPRQMPQQQTRPAPQSPRPAPAAQPESKPARPDGPDRR